MATATITSPVTDSLATAMPSHPSITTEPVRASYPRTPDRSIPKDTPVEAGPKDIGNEVKILILGSNGNLKIDTELSIQENKPNKYQYKEYQWYTVDPSTNEKKTIEGANTNAYKVTKAELGKKIFVEIKFGDTKVDAELLVDAKANRETEKVVQKSKMLSPDENEANTIIAMIVDNQNNNKIITLTNIQEKFTNNGGTLQYLLNIDGELSQEWKEVVVLGTGENMGLITDPALNNIEGRKK